MQHFPQPLPLLYHSEEIGFHFLFMVGFLMKYVLKEKEDVCGLEQCKDII